MPTFTGPRTWSSADRLGEALGQVSLNTNLRDNMRHLKESADVTFVGGTKLPYKVRNVEMNWQKLSDAQFGIVTTGTGAGVSRGGTGQMVLNADASVVGTAYIQLTDEVNGALNNAFSSSNIIMVSVPIAISNVATQFQCWVGLRQTPSAFIPVGGEHSLGIFASDVSPIFVFRSSNATDVLQVNDVSDQNIWHCYTIQFIPSPAVSRQLRFYRNDATGLGSQYRANQNLGIPATGNDLQFSALIRSAGIGGAQIVRLTIGNIRIQEYAP